MSYKVGDAVRWISSNTKKDGIVVGTVAAGELPHRLGFAGLGQTSLPRGHDSYVVKGGVFGQKATLYWPVVSLLHPADGLTSDEIVWCHRNVGQVRALIRASTSARTGP